MRWCRLIPLLGLLTLAACGGGNDDDGGGGDTAARGVDTGGGGKALQFEQVRGFTLDHLKGEPAVTEECKKLAWDGAEERSQGALPTGTKTSEMLTCDDVPYLAYLEFDDAAAARKGLAEALLPYLIAEEAVVLPLLAVDVAASKRYLEALKAKCACGEVVTPKTR